MTSPQLDLQTACRMGQIEAIKQAFNENNSKLNEKDPSVISEQLGWCPLYRTVISGNYQATEFLLSEGADPNNPNNLGETPLHQAADNSQYSIAELLLLHQANPNFQQNDGDSPLHHAAFRGDQKMVEILLNSRADPNLRNYMVRDM
jgi:ankyrin repeat protein